MNSWWRQLCPQDNLHVKQSPNNWTKMLDRLYLKEGSIEFIKAPKGRLFIKRHLKKSIFWSIISDNPPNSKKKFSFWGVWHMFSIQFLSPFQFWKYFLHLLTTEMSDRWGWWGWENVLEKPLEPYWPTPRPRAKRTLNVLMYPTGWPQKWGNVEVGRIVWACPPQQRGH